MKISCDTHLRFTFPIYSCLVLLMLFFASGLVCADQFHYKNVLVGDRAAGMGGAYSAIADDASGLFYNPAGIVFSASHQITGSMNALHTTSAVYKSALGGNTDWKRTSNAFLPNFFGIFQPFAFGTLGFSYAATDSIQEDQDQSFTNITNTAQPIDRFTINFNNNDTTINIGPSFAYKVTDNLSFGITLYLHLREQERILHQLIDFSDSGGTPGDYFESSEYLAINEKGVRGIAGVMWSPLDKLSLSFVASHSSVTSSDIERQYTQKLQNESEITYELINSKEKRELPNIFTVGAAYFFNERFLLSSDFSYYSSTEDKVSGERVAISNIAVGGEWYFDSKMALRFGYYTNNANTPNLRSYNVSQRQAEHVDLQGFSLSLSHFTRSSVLSLGLNYSYGSGKAQLFSADTDTQTARLQDVDLDTLTIFISGSHSF